MSTTTFKVPRGLHFVDSKFRKAVSRWPLCFPASRIPPQVGTRQHGDVVAQLLAVARSAVIRRETDPSVNSGVNRACLATPHSLHDLSSPSTQNLAVGAMKNVRKLRLDVS